MTMKVSRRALVAAATMTTLAPRLVWAQESDAVLTIASEGILEASPPPGSFDIQTECLYGNSEFLLRPTMDGPQPWLAEKVEQIEPTRWRVTLRPDLTFQNGSPLDAEALLACFDFYAGPENLGDPDRIMLGRPTAMEVSGPLTLDIVTEEPFSRLPFSLAHYAYPIFDAAAVAAVDGDWGQLVDKGIFTGPYQWSAIEPGLVTYTRNEGYWAGRPALSGIAIKQVPDEQAALQAIATGEADVLPYASLALAPIAQATPGANLIVGPGGVNFIGLALEPRIAPFDDVLVRRALAFAIDNDAIAASVGQGIAIPMQGWFPSGDPLAVDWKVYDPAQAEALLDEAGWTREGDGPRMKDGQPLEARFYAYFDMGEGVSTVAADMAAKVGFAPTIRRFESYAEIQPVQSEDGGIYTVNTESYGLNGDPLTTMRNVIDPGYTTPGYPDWIAIIDPVLSSSDEAEIADALRAGQELNAEEVYWIPVMDYGTPFVVSDAYAEIVPNPFYLFVDWQTAPRS